MMMMEKISYQVGPITDEIRKKIFQGFQEYAKSTQGYEGDNLDQSPIAFQAFSGELFIGAVVAKVFWGQIHIQYVYVHPEFRQHGVGRALMHQLLTWAKQQEADFIFVETLSFQAVDFYKSFGFSTEFERKGYKKRPDDAVKDISFHYMTLYLH